MSVAADSSSFGNPFWWVRKKRFKIRKFGSGALPGKMLLVRIIEDNKVDAYFV